MYFSFANLSVSALIDSRFKQKKGFFLYINLKMDDWREANIGPMFKKKVTIIYQKTNVPSP